MDKKREKKIQEQNKSTFESPKFREDCKKAGIEPTRRQASKYGRKKGLAFKYKQVNVGEKGLLTSHSSERQNDGAA